MTKGVLPCLLLLLISCAPDPGDDEPGLAPPEVEPGGALARLRDGKFDATGHPIGARVFEAERSCAPAIGTREAEGWGARVSRDANGLLCQIGTRLDDGQYVVNARLLNQKRALGLEPDTEVARLVVSNAADGATLAERAVRPIDFSAPRIYTNVSLEFETMKPEEIRVELRWHDKLDLRLDYVEFFRPRLRALLSPPSGKPAVQAVLTVDVASPPDASRFRLSCNGTNLDTQLQTLLDEGKASVKTAQFWARLRAPLSPLTASCNLPARFRADVTGGTGYPQTASRVTYISGSPPCSFAAGKRRVLITGFEPFPADTSSVNSSEQAVLALQDSDVPEASVMRMVIPVEWESAPAQVADVIRRCQPEVVLSFGEGTGLNLERLGRNRRDAAMLAGGVTDNRGAVVETSTIEPSGPETRQSTVPVDAVAAGLAEAGISYELSDDAGSYLCNNMLYASLGAAGDSSATRVGFIHLPQRYQVTAEERETLRRIVRVAIQRSLSPTSSPPK